MQIYFLLTYLLTYLLTGEEMGRYLKLSECPLVILLGY